MTGSQSLPHLLSFSGGPHLLLFPGVLIRFPENSNGLGLARLSDPTDTCLPTTVWFLYSEDDVPLGSIYRSCHPEVGVRIEDGAGFTAADVVSFTELRTTCAMRRFRVVVRPLP